MQWIEKCLASIPLGCPVIVIDNASKDKTVSYIKNNFPTVKVLEQKENLGFGQANNKGIAKALKDGAENVFLLNQDAYLQEGCLENLMAAQAKNTKYGILSPIHLNGKGNRLDTNFAKYVSIQNNPDFYSDFVLKKTLKPIYKVPFVNAAGWLLPKEVLKKAGGFDPIFFHYGEDDNYCQRLLYHGYKIGVVPNAFLKHEREVRPKTKIQYGSDSFFTKIERSFKVKYGNINIESIEKLISHKQKRKKQYKKALLRINLTQATILKKEITLINKIIPEIERSRCVNKKKGPHYLKDI